MKINVLEKDFLRGVPCEASYCPVARAVARAAGLDVGNTVANSTYIELRPMKGRYTMYRTPDEVADFINRFDETPDGVYEPFSFEMTEMPKE